jgi:hypothetical protein
VEAESGLSWLENPRDARKKYKINEDSGDKSDFYTN